jgi:HNH endonuclease
LSYLKGTLQERFANKVNKTETCWLWTATGTKRYGQIRLAGQGSPMVYAHRLAYEFANGPIPEGLEVDHLCRVGYCVRPDHLEAVTPKENCRRRPKRAPRDLGETCKAGHPRTPENTRINKSVNGRYCRLCANEATRRCNAARRGGVPSLTIR